jgi:hypothetical protein
MGLGYHNPLSNRVKKSVIKRFVSTESYALLRLFTAAILLALAMQSAQAQPILKEYKGRYINGSSFPAEAEYTFYQGKQGEEIRHGSFNYQVRETNGSDKYSQSVRGRYADGLKDGTWTYRVSVREYQELNSPDFLTGNIILVASYSKGRPQGRWEYTFSMKSRQEIVENGVRKPGRFTPTRKIRMVVNFNQGIMIDSVIISDTHGTSIFGVFDAAGFYHQDWIFLTDSTEEIFAYDHGVLIRHSYRMLSSEKFEVEEDLVLNVKKLQKLREALPGGKTALSRLAFTPDTICLFDNPNHQVRRLIIDRLYSDKDFLYRYIPGDLNFIFDESRKQFRINMKGGYTIEFLVKLTAEEQSRMARIKVLRGDIVELNSRTALLVQGKTLAPNHRSSVDLIAYNATLADGYLCVANNIAQAEEVTEGISSAKNCRLFTKVNETCGKATTKTQAFDAMINDLQNMKLASAKYYNLLRQN